MSFYLSKMLRCTTVVILLFLACSRADASLDRPRYNGDIYIVSLDKMDSMPDQNDELDDDDDSIQDTNTSKVLGSLDMEAVMHECNTSFVTAIPDLVHFNTTGSLPDEKDKTAMCYMRCFFEKSGLLEDFKLNADLVRKYIWPATGDSLEFCQNEGKNESNACIRAYNIIKCITVRAITDARNKPTV